MLIVFPALSNIICPSPELLNASSNWLLSLLWLQHTKREGARSCQEQTHTSHPEEISTFPVLFSPLVSWPFLCLAHIFASLFASLFYPFLRPLIALSYLDDLCLCVMGICTLMFSQQWAFLRETKTL